MRIAHHQPAQRELVHRLIDWGSITSRCKRYPAIGRAFPTKVMEKHCETKPYYCHYMSFRLGTWKDETLFERLDALLCCAEKLSDWEYETPLLLSPEYCNFWSLVWQLQVAEHLCDVGTDVSWAESGPDLSVTLDNERWYVECYTPQKSFGLLCFIEDILCKSDPDIGTSYDLCLPFKLPSGLERNRFLDKVLSRFLNTSCLANAKERAKREYPVVLYQDPDSSLYIFVDGHNADAYRPSVVPNRVGDAKSYVDLVLKEAADAKQGKNNLENCRPNLVVVNCLLSTDFQVAVDLKGLQTEALTLPAISRDIDALGVCAVRIDEPLTKDNLRILKIRSDDLDIRSLGQIASVRVEQV